MDINDLRIYNPVECAVFCKTQEKYGGNSNMCRDYPLVVNGIEIPSSEALYQAFRFPFCIEAQQEIIAQSNAMQAKMMSKKYRKEFNREDWSMVHVPLMRWSIRVKLLQNWKKFSHTLLETGNLTVVERSNKADDFWGTVVVKEFIPQKGKYQRKPPKYPASEKMPVGFLVGFNVMGRLIQELRENVKTGCDPMSHDFTRLDPLAIPNFLLYGKPINAVFRK